MTKASAESDGAATTVAPPQAPQRPELRIGFLTLFGLLILAAFASGFVAWASIAPLSSAALAPGVVVVEGSRKVIQHLEGGIISNILVTDGQRVKAGDVLIRLDVTRAETTLSLLQLRMIDAQALAARLRAERDSNKTIAFPAELLARRDEAKINLVLGGQSNIFAARTRSVTEQVDIIGQRIGQLRQEITGLKAQIAAQNRQQQLLNEEIGDVKLLISKGLARKPRLLALQRRLAEISGSRSRNTAAIARTRQRIGENRLMITVLGTRRVNEAVAELKEVRAEIYDLRERIRASEYVLRRTEITAPLAGVIVDLQVHTAGGVIAAGARLMDIVPSGDRLVIEARIDPKDIDVVRLGQEAQIRLTAHNQRHISPLTGRLFQVSADRLADNRTGEVYYLAKIRLPDNLEEILSGLQVTPGMQAEVVILTGERTVFDYFLQPVKRSFRRAFRED